MYILGGKGEKGGGKEEKGGGKGDLLRYPNRNYTSAVASRSSYGREGGLNLTLSVVILQVTTKNINIQLNFNVYNQKIEEGSQFLGVKSPFLEGKFQFLCVHVYIFKKMLKMRTSSSVLPNVYICQKSGQKCVHYAQNAYIWHRWSLTLTPLQRETERERVE